MNLAAVSPYLPDIVLRDTTPADADAKTHVLSNKQLSLHTESGPQKQRRYNYYVVSEGLEDVYTKQKITEKLSSAQLGRIINVYA